jgi:DNA-binding NtrC family response regulator
LLHIHECLNGKRLARDAVKMAESVPIKGTDPELMALMLSGWALLSCRIGRPSAAVALIQRAKVLASDETHPEIGAEAMRVESVIADTTGNKARCEQILKDILRFVPSHSPRRKFHVWELALFLARQGRGMDSQAEMRELAWQGSDRFKMSRLLLVQFVNAVETGRAQQAHQILSQMKTTPHSPRDLARVPYLGYQALLALMQPPRDRSAANRHKPENDPLWVQVVQSLLRRQTAEALQLARQEAGKLMGSIFDAGFESFNLIRAELASGKWEGAVRLLKLRQARGNRHYLDDFFFARAERLAGNVKNAARHFAEALRAAECYLARGRLDFELALACELSQADVVQLARSADKAPKKGGVAPTHAAPPPRQVSRAFAGFGAASAPAAEPQSSAPDDTTESAEANTRVQRALNMIRGRSAAIAAVRDTVTRFADLDAPVLITGETGTGKELVARALHEVSRQRDEPFTAINCSSITETLLESELFGHERGAFTGAEKAGKGLFEATGKGTIFLDEIGDISPRLQAALLRVLETGEIRAVGSTATRRIACRIVAATNADLATRAEQGHFRRDLLFRLQRLCLHIAPLRERRDDIMVLVRHFLDTGRRIGVHASVSPALSETLRGYDWPGNIRELRNVVERMRLMHSDKIAYDLEDLDLKFQSPGIAVAERDHRSAPQPVVTPPVETVARPRPASEDDVRRLLHEGRSAIRRLDRLRDLFATHEKLTRSEVVEILGISPNTATKDLKTLCDQGVIVRVEPSASTRSHYFVLKR